MHELQFCTSLTAMAEEQVPDVAPGLRAAPVRDRTWFRVLAVLVLLGVFTVLYVRVVRHDVVATWEILATCPAEAGTAPATVTRILDTSACSTNPSRAVSGRGWPIVTFVLSSAAGLDPTITRVLSDDRSRTLRAEYDAPTGSPSGSGVVLAFIELPERKLPDVPFTVEGASGPVTVTTVPAG